VFRIYEFNFCFLIGRLREAQNRVKIKKRVPLRPGRISGPLPVPDHIPKPSYVGSTQLPELSTGIQIHDSEGISGMRAACQLAARALDLAGILVRVSVCYFLFLFSYWHGT
jgi:methionyl aminopeptidase